MTGVTIIPAFDYAALDADTRTALEISEQMIKGLLRNNARNIIDAGKELTKVKERLGHGHFMAWCEQRFGWTLRTAERYMAVAEKFDSVSHLEQFSATALYSLAAPSTPDEVVEDMAARAAAGETITPAVIKTAVAAAQETRQQQDAAQLLDLLKQHGPLTAQALRDQAGMGTDAGRFYRAMSVLEGSRQLERLEKGQLRWRDPAANPPGTPKASPVVPGETALYATLDDLAPTAVPPVERDPFEVMLNQPSAQVAHDAAALGGDDLRQVVEVERRGKNRSQLIKWLENRISEIPATVAGLTPDEARLVNSLPQRQREMLYAVATNQPLVHNAATRAALIRRGLVNSHPSVWAVTLTVEGQALAALLLKLDPPAEVQPGEPPADPAARESRDPAAERPLPPGVVFRDLHVDPVAYSDDHDPDLAEGYRARLEFEKAILALQDAARAFCAIRGIRALHPLPAETLHQTAILLTDMRETIGQAQRHAFTQYDRLAFMAAHHRPYDDPETANV